MRKTWTSCHGVALAKLDEHIMTDLERMLALVEGRPVDRGIFAADFPLNDTTARWFSEGMSYDHDFGYDLQESAWLDYNAGYCPAWSNEVLEDEGETELVRDGNGVVKRQWKGNRSGMPQFVSFPVHDRASWEEVKPRLDPDNPDRYGAAWSDCVEKVKDTELMTGFSAIYLGGSFSYLRHMCGDNVYYMFHDEPELIREMLEFQGYRMCKMMDIFHEHGVRIDEFFIWEDMCYKTGPLIGPEMFRVWMMGLYVQMIGKARECGARIINLDSDGNVSELLPLWVEAGVNMCHPFEVAAGMDVVEIKRQYGDQLLVRGGVDKREIAKGRDAIDREMARVNKAYEMGGYIPTMDHAVPPNVSWKDFLYFTKKKKEMVGL